MASMETTEVEGLKNVFSVDIAVPRARVWRELTATGSVQPFYFDTVLDSTMQPGAPLRYQTRNGKHVFITGEVLELIPEQRFSHSFQFTDLQDPPSTVCFELEEIEGGTRLTVTHEGSAGIAKTMTRATRGWKSIFANLKSQLERGRLPLKSRVMHGIMRLMTPLLPKNSN